MAYIATVKILVDQANESAIYDDLNEFLREVEMDGPNGEAPLVIDWKYVSVAPIAPEIEDSIMNETYEEGDAFRSTAPTIDQPFNLVIEAYAVSEFGDGPAHAEVTVDPTFIDRLVRLCRLCKENDLESVTICYPVHEGKVRQAASDGGIAHEWLRLAMARRYVAFMIIVIIKNAIFRRHIGRQKIAVLER